MFGALAKGFRWLTLLSLLFWSGVAVYIGMSQPVERPAADLPATYAECAGRYAAASPYPEIQAEVRKLCGSYYAVIGDRSIPFHKRLYARVVGRIVDDMIVTYLAKYPPQPGERVDGPQMLAKLGTPALLGFAWESVTEADKPSPASQSGYLACQIRQTRAAASQVDVLNVPMMCPHRR